MHIENLTRPELIFPALEAEDREEVLRAFSERLAEERVVDDASELYRKLLEREQLGSTGIGSGVAIPHCKLDHLSEAVLAIGISRKGVEFGAMDSEPVRLFFLLVSPTDAPAIHLQVLAAISKWIKTDRHVPRMLKLKDRGAIYHMLEEEG
ncbi:MAG: PTS sugar transporter subunit IIA [Acidobacteriota bacterium]|jgi:PTS system nitrogen regulatory IIA component